MIGAYTTYSSINVRTQSNRSIITTVCTPHGILYSRNCRPDHRSTCCRHLCNRPLNHYSLPGELGCFDSGNTDHLWRQYQVNSPTGQEEGLKFRKILCCLMRDCTYLDYPFCVYALFTLSFENRFGMLIRTAMQNQDMANSLGVKTRK